MRVYLDDDLENKSLSTSVQFVKGQDTGLRLGHSGDHPVAEVVLTDFQNGFGQPALSVLGGGKFFENLRETRHLKTIQEIALLALGKRLAEKPKILSDLLWGSYQTGIGFGEMKARRETSEKLQGLKELLETL